ncbi:MAG: anthranilate synthase component II [Flavobacteriales bacterium]
MRILLLDNYDSFTWNLHHDLERISDVRVDVHRNDEVNLANVPLYDGIVLSPGPGLPMDAGRLMQLIPIAAAHKIPLLGVCLGMQAIAEYFGATLRNLDDVLHGRTTQIHELPHRSGIFHGIEVPMTVGHYHSWVVDEEDFPEVLIITARNEEGLPLALAHRTLPIAAVQFHPESVLTPAGRQLLRNWCGLVNRYSKSQARKQG